MQTLREPLDQALLHPLAELGECYSHTTAKKLGLIPLPAHLGTDFRSKALHSSPWKLNVCTKPKRDALLRAVSGRDRLDEAFRICGERGAVLAVICCYRRSRGESLLMGCTNMQRLNTDGDTFLCYVLRRAQYEALRDKLILADAARINSKPFHLRLLAALVASGLYVQDRTTYEVRKGDALLKIGFPGSTSDVVAFLLDCQVLSGVVSVNNRANCWAGIWHLCEALFLLDKEKFRRTYGAPTREEALRGSGLPPLYDAGVDIHGLNITYVCALETLMRRVVEGDLKATGVRIRCVHPDKGTPSELSHVFTSKMVADIRSAGDVRLFELSKQPPYSSLIAEALWLTGELPFMDGLRRGDSHPEWMPEVKCMKRIFQGKFETTGYYRGTLLFALGVVYCRVDGDQGVLLQKGVEPSLDVGAIAAARDARDRAVTQGLRPEQTAAERRLFLRARDAEGDAKYQLVVPGAAERLRAAREEFEREAPEREQRRRFFATYRPLARPDGDRRAAVAAHFAEEERRARCVTPDPPDPKRARLDDAPNAPATLEALRDLLAETDHED